MKKPIAPYKPSMPSEPTKPEEYGYYEQKNIPIKNFYMDYDIHNDHDDSHTLEASLTLEQFTALQLAVNQFQLEHTNVSDVKINMVYHCIEYKEYGLNPYFIRETKAYEKNLAAYKKNMTAYNIMQEKYLIDLKEYEKLKLQWDLEQAKENLKRLEKKANPTNE